MYFWPAGDTLKLADFGIAKVMHGKFAQTIVGGTPCYMAPELLYKEKYDTKSDMWSLGCLMWELSTRSLLSQSKGVLGAQVCSTVNSRPWKLHTAATVGRARNACLLLPNPRPWTLQNGVLRSYSP